ncbi:flagellin, partial [Kiloniella spongiae]
LGAAGVVNNITADLSTVNVAAVTGDVSTSGTAATAFTNVTARINTIATGRATVGALISRFETRGQQVATSIENIEAANSKLKDVDLAAEQSRLVTANVLTQAAVSALSQANQIPQTLLRVLQ